MNCRTLKPLSCLALIFLVSNLPAKESSWTAGAARIDTTPEYPIRLSGYLARKTESQGVATRLNAKALALGTDKQHPAIIITVDATGIPLGLRNEVVEYLRKAEGIDPARVAICVSHTHTAPCLSGFLPTLFGEPIPPEHQEHIARYTRELTAALEKVALEALHNRRPAKLAWGEGRAGFAADRRTKGGPVDDDLPLLVVSDARGKLTALVGNYACHCTTLGPETNLVCGDWAGYAQQYLEADFPGAICLFAIGCGGDANPEPRTGLAYAQQHGHEIQTAVHEILARTSTPLHGPLECRTKQIALPFDKPRTRQEWEEMAKQAGPVGYYARVNVDKLKRGEKLPSELPYLVQEWNFDDNLAMLFLAGEVVVDYSLRLKREFDSRRLWVNAYANDVPCYIPSERILTEGGYEGGGAMVYYDKPNRLAPGVESLIVEAVHDLIPASFRSEPEKSENPPPVSPKESLNLLRTKAGLKIELVAAEPLVESPVAIDWGRDGSLWVAEMYDYPMGLDGKWKPGSRIKRLYSSKHDGHYDKASLFLDNLPFVTGVTAWRKGVLICSAPDILYAEDTDGDGRADIVKKLFTGFFTDNYQARVNSLSLGLDNWIYGANGLLGGVIRGQTTPLQGADKPVEVDIRGRDFRMRPDSGAFEPASGLTQQGRARDDWGNWFGCDNSTLAWHYPLADQYIRRNPNVPAPSPRVWLNGGTNPTLLYPISRTLERFNEPNAANHVTSACGLGVYRDSLLGQEFYGNLFVCEPVHNLVRRLVLGPDGASFRARRAADEEHSEFLASRDNWFRPVQARTGPDGALWVVDMYRFVIEHPRWIPPDRLAKLDPRAGADKGRIYRVYPANAALRPIRDLTKLSGSKLAGALDTENGTERDRIHQELVFTGGKERSSSAKPDADSVAVLKGIALRSSNPPARLQALCVLDGWHAITAELLEQALGDSSPGVVANAVRLSEPLLGVNTTVAEKVLALARSSSPRVRFQIALSLGEWDNSRAGSALGELARADSADSWMRAAVLSSASHRPVDVLKAVISLPIAQAGRTELVEALVATTVGQNNPQTLAEVLGTILPERNQQPERWQLHSVQILLEALQRHSIGLEALGSSAGRLRELLSWSRTRAADSSADESSRELAVSLLGKSSENRSADFLALSNIVEQGMSTRLQNAVFDAFKGIPLPAVATMLLSHWDQRAPSLRQGTIALLVTRDDWIRELLGAMENQAVGLNEISPANRQRLWGLKDAALRERARALWKNSNPGNRSELVTKYLRETSDLSAEPSRGAQVFANVCSTCHFLHGQGHAVGPDLAVLSNKSLSDFVTAIIDPNAAVEPRFIAYNIDTRDGRSLSGVVSSESATTLTLTQGGGISERILKTDIAQIRASGVSLMPEGLEQNISPQDMANLVAWLKTSPKPFGSASPEAAQTNRQQFAESVRGGSFKVTSAFDKLPYASWLGTLPLAYCRQTDGKSKLVWQATPVVTVTNAEGMRSFRFPAAMGYSSQPSGKFELSLEGKPVLEFDVSLTDRSWTSADGKVLMSYSVMENDAEDSNGVLVLEIASSLCPAEKPVNLAVIGSATNSQRWFGLYDVWSK